MLAAIAGTMFDIVTGVILAQAATTLASIPAFYYTHIVGRELVVRRMGPRLKQFDELLKNRGFHVLLLIRLCPVGNAFITSCVAGVSAIPLRVFIVSSFLGFLPQNHPLRIPG